MNTTCVYKLIAIGFLIGTLMQLLVPKQDAQFKGTLTPEQRKTYDTIVKERLRIFAFAWIFSLMFVWRLPVDRWTRVVVYHLLLGAIYECWPKSTYMVEHLHTSSQIQQWQQVYRQMQFRHAIALLVNLVAIPWVCT